ncbi:MAG: class I SAM-dependent methyltransferase [Gammaproteobacteria bacterium]|nr:class I SAM-dependent methyltransferase [Gammaproteobacteria bacterium]
MEKPFSQACENNKDPILSVLKRVFARARRVLEIGSGTGQHSVHFAPNLAHLEWYTSDLTENLAGIRLWMEEQPSENLFPPTVLDVNASDWPIEDFDAVFSANTAHIMHWPDVESMFRGVARYLPTGGRFALYGPFSYHGVHTSESNARFDLSLRARDPRMGVRDFDALDELAEVGSLVLLEDNEMPANNRILVWEKR